VQEARVLQHNRESGDSGTRWRQQRTGSQRSSLPYE
jgi:hypothetical protein